MKKIIMKSQKTISGKVEVKSNSKINFLVKNASYNNLKKVYEVRVFLICLDDNIVKPLKNKILKKEINLNGRFTFNKLDKLFDDIDKLLPKDLELMIKENDIKII